MVGQNARGHWVVQDLRSARGGLFVDRVSALRYVRSEGGGRRQLTVMVSGAFELDMGKTPEGSTPRPLPAVQAAHRDVA
jgi:hypothetical protein